MTPRYLLPTLAAALLLLTTTGCPESARSDASDSETLVDAGGGTDTSPRNNDSNGTPTPTFPDAGEETRPCWPTRHANPANTRVSPCFGPSNPVETRQLLSHQLDDSTSGRLITRAGPFDMLVIGQARDQRPPVVHVFDTSSDARTSWALDGDDIELADLGVAPDGRIVTLETHGASSDGSMAVVRAFDPSGSPRWSRTLDLPDDVSPRPDALHVVGETRFRNLRAVVRTDTEQTFVYRLAPNGDVENTASDPHVVRQGYAFDRLERMALLAEPRPNSTDGEPEVRLKVRVSGPRGPEEVLLSEHKFDLGGEPGRPSTTRVRPFFFPDSDEAMMLLSTGARDDFNWACLFGDPVPHYGLCKKLTSDDQPLGFADESMLVGDWLIGLERPRQGPALGSISLNPFGPTPESPRTLVEDGQRAMTSVADRRGRIYALIRPANSDAHTELVSARPNGEVRWRTDPELPDAFPEDLIVGDRKLYAIYLRTRSSPSRLEVYQVGR
jgi:hypothetical protein